MIINSNTLKQRWEKYCSYNIFDSNCNNKHKPSEEISLQSINDEKMTESCKIARSLSYWSGGVSPKEDDIYKTYQSLIKNSEKYLYFENQYQLSWPYSDNDIAPLITERIIRAIDEKANFTVIIMKPFSADRENSVIGMKKTFFLGKDSMVQRIMDHIQTQKTNLSHSDEYLNWISNKTWQDFLSINFLGATTVNETDANFRQIYIHAKIMIGDDRYAFIGSANWNDRSLKGDRDSEINILVKTNNMTMVIFHK